MSVETANLVVQHDDLGYFPEMNEAFLELAFPTGSVIAGAPSFEHLMSRLPSQGANLGVHLTLTSDIPSIPLRPISAGPSLVDSNGLFAATTRDAWERVSGDEAKVEFEAQISRALEGGLKISYLDSHMSVTLRPDLFREMLSLSERFCSDGFIFIPPPESTGLFNSYYKAHAKYPESLEICKSFRGNSYILVDTYLIPPAQKKKWYCEVLVGLPPGRYRLIHHAAVPSRFVHALEDGEVRISDYECLQDADVRDALAFLGAHRLSPWNQVDGLVSS